MTDPVSSIVSRVRFEDNSIDTFLSIDLDPEPGAMTPLKLSLNGKPRTSSMNNQQGTASINESGDLVGITCVKVKPAFASSCRNSSSVRSLPLAKVIIS